MTEALINLESAVEKAMDEAIKSGATALEVHETAFGKLVNKSLALRVSPANIVFEMKTAEQQLVGMAIARSKQTQTVIEAIRDLPGGFQTRGR